MRIVEPAIDLGIAMAIVSSFKNKVIDDKTIAFGEIGLSGEVRGVSMAEQRVAEAAKLGFTTCIVPEVNRRQIKPVDSVKIVGVRTVQDAIDCI
jgi:DNA repair protein RadA/Sms